MIKETLTAIAASLIFTVPASATVSDAEQMRAQGDMLRREDAAIKAYAGKIGVSDELVSYCQTRLNMETANAPAGMIPFGVDYRTIEDTKQLSTIIYARESYETSYIKLCLANAKKALKDAERP